MEVDVWGVDVKIRSHLHAVTVKNKYPFLLKAFAKHFVRKHYSNKLINFLHQDSGLDAWKQYFHTK